MRKHARSTPSRTLVCVQVVMTSVTPSVRYRIGLALASREGFHGVAGRISFALCLKERGDSQREEK